jgi:hypothetical protein
MNTTHNGRKCYMIRALLRRLFRSDRDVLPAPAARAVVRNGGPFWPHWWRS